MTTLITGFEPFSKWKTNPSALVAEAFADEATVGVLPVDLASCPTLVSELIDEYRPDLVLSLGLAGTATSFLVERIGINLIDAPILDEAGNQPTDQVIISSGPAAYFATLPVKAVTGAIRAIGLPAELSCSAGTFACNAVMYAALEYADRMPEMVRPKCGFIHLPPLEVIPLEDQIRAVRAALAAAKGDEADYPAGSLD